MKRTAKIILIVLILFILMAFTDKTDKKQTPVNSNGNGRKIKY